MKKEISKSKQEFKKNYGSWLLFIAIVVIGFIVVTCLGAFYLYLISPS